MAASVRSQDHQLVFHVCYAWHSAVKKPGLGWIRCRQGFGCYVVELSRTRKNSIWGKKKPNQKTFISCQNSLSIHPIPMDLEEWTMQGESRTGAGEGRRRGGVQERDDGKAIWVALGWQRTFAKEVQAWKACSKELSHPSECQKWQSRFWKWIKCWLCSCKKKKKEVSFSFAIFHKYKSPGRKRKEKAMQLQYPYRIIFLAMPQAVI